jgi:hypothetical protein
VDLLYQILTREFFLEGFFNLTFGFFKCLPEQLSGGEAAKLGERFELTMEFAWNRNVQVDGLFAGRRAFT